ncbi:hypothetical protein WG902_09765 [Ramlibacter sp. PS3R-8]|uniref:hypothetical protein n=1 Tax=Ramlibacter sp. PS3R-8 TaxID=3133437 RepID=UPI0030A202B6
MHVLLLELPRLLRGILEHAISTDADCELVREPQDTPDVVILGLTDANDSTLLPALFARWPGAQVMTLQAAGDDADLYELRLDRRTLAGVSPTEILQVLREGGGPRPAPPAE